MRISKMIAAAALAALGILGASGIAAADDDPEIVHSDTNIGINFGELW